MTMKQILEATTKLAEQLEALELDQPATAGEFGEQYDTAYRLSSAVNRLKRAADKTKRTVKYAVIEYCDAQGIDGIPATINGRKVTFTRYEFRAADIVDLDEFRAWAESEDAEAYFESEPRVRKELLNSLVIQRDDDGQAPPPGLAVYREDRLSRSAKDGAGPTPEPTYEDDE